MELTIAINEANGYPSFGGSLLEPIWAVITREDTFTASELAAEFGEYADEYEPDADGLYKFEEPIVNVHADDLTYAQALEVARKLGFAGPTYGGR